MISRGDKDIVLSLGAVPKLIQKHEVTRVMVVHSVVAKLSLWFNKK